MPDAVKSSSRPGDRDPMHPDLDDELTRLAQSAANTAGKASQAFAKKLEEILERWRLAE